MFEFKQFRIKQDRCAMKVGTDGVLLGAWTPIFNNPYSILDIGSGTGLIALMLAQRSKAEQIDALEIDDDAYEQCVDNFEHSRWNDRLYCYHAGLDEFVDEVDEEYDLIVSNPPFYTTDYKSNEESRDRARFEDALPFEELIEAADFFLSDHGIFSLIIPFSEESKIKTLCLERSLYPLQITRVKGTPKSEIKRSLIAFTRIEQEPIIDELIIEYSRHNYTEKYSQLTQDFYLKM
ncbi:tRNA1(Val) (adenine(37)-N6)-methyltransferase [Flavobacterium oreochromis]|uniref:tRNA1(Val) (adenine(37)-N6)-methyltransferase n=2 Tax=Flavobacterium TaxID=237 RepID=A0A246GD73_9FLAO|nr:methyltransferase [Flavobacterium oreochromis]OWP78499.1 tRNA (adenine-N(6)-)-methyltransferase [Flavobacterium oreochromis]OWP79268.1 tRNA (adenine-N(6)-)-methyltransferase [Flavobacterium oreochromis]QYS86991.1 methyltransferase [Flavobacterium oreochromis]